jgi:hypothetical protein
MEEKGRDEKEEKKRRCFVFAVLAVATVGLARRSSARKSEAKDQ